MDENYQNRDLRTQGNDKSLSISSWNNKHLSSGIGRLLSLSNKDLNELQLRKLFFSVFLNSVVCANKVAVLQVM